MLRVLTAVALTFVVAACEVPTPLAPAEPIGTVPNWGADFATPTQQPRSMLAAGMGGAPGEGMPPPGSAMPGAIKNFSGGDATAGKGIWQALCARCHGAAGEGGALPGNVAVPALADAATQDKLTDAQMARTIALGKGAMPPFMQELDRDKLANVIAFIRSLKKP
jgi:mono/diheme cytochrome c family protein